MRSHVRKFNTQNISIDITWGRNFCTSSVCTKILHVKFSDAKYFHTTVVQYVTLTVAWWMGFGTFFIGIILLFLPALTTSTCNKGVKVGAKLSCLYVDVIGGHEERNYLSYAFLATLSSLLPLTHRHCLQNHCHPHLHL